MSSNSFQSDGAGRRAVPSVGGRQVERDGKAEPTAFFVCSQAPERNPPAAGVANREARETRLQSEAPAGVPQDHLR
jgi:hypothetical protein